MGGIFRFINRFFLMALILMVTAPAAAGKRKISKYKGSNNNKPQYKSQPHNPDFMNSCTTTHPSIYKPGAGGIQGGKKNRMGNPVTSVEEAAKTGKPVTIAMDKNGDFGAQCNYKNNLGTEFKSCLVLVHYPDLDVHYPEYGKKFPNLPANSFLALVEDTGGAFYDKGTGKMDIPFSTKNWHQGSPFVGADKKTLTQAKFEVLKANVTNLKAMREKDFSHFSPYVGGRRAKCDGEVSRRTHGAPAWGGSNHSSIATRSGGRD